MIEIIAPIIGFLVVCKVLRYIEAICFFRYVAASKAAEAAEQ